jgi:hypothetical protein
MKKSFFLFMLAIASLKIHAEFNSDFEEFKKEMLDKFSCNSIEDCKNKNLNANEFQNKYKELTYSAQSKYRKAMKTYDNQTNFINAFEQQISQLEKDLINNVLQENKQSNINPWIAGIAVALFNPLVNYFDVLQDESFVLQDESFFKNKEINISNFFAGLGNAFISFITYHAVKGYTSKSEPHALNQLDQMHKIRDWIVYDNNEHLAAKNRIKLVKPE